MFLKFDFDSIVFLFLEWNVFVPDGSITFLGATTAATIISVFVVVACNHIHPSTPGILFGLDTKLIATLKVATLNRKSWYLINLFPVWTRS